ncbi:F-box/kelch-repeat protein At3g23880-like [Rosa rugosa]|uniref:F-box/kelch-repeat protein At3g23880-like n=1 Tax=Rosa rugosa TaxID=74645 RepID=UPI002B40837E|nr:F-box/kelch-repeat protein At3g23880-like [Rosa rugosa]
MSDALFSRQQQQLVLSGTGPSSESLDFGSVIVEILSWLPAKSLLRFRCVCKPWRALFSDPYFIRRHLSRINTKTNNSYSLFVKEISTFRSMDCEALFKYSSHDDGPVLSRELDFPILDVPFEFYYIDIIGSCNGLICLLLDWNTSVIMLWNPCTRESKVLPQPSIKNLPKFYGFGYDSTTDDYKVIVGSFSSTSSYEYVVVAYTLKTGSWRKLQSLNQNFRVLWHGCLVNEALHWVLDERDEDHRVIASKLVSFDLAEEKFHEIASPYCPNPIARSNLVARVGNISNSLTLYSRPISTRAGLDFRMWVMKEYGVEKSWNEVMKIPPEVLPGDYCKCLKPLCISGDGVTLIEVFIDLEDRGFLILHNPKEKTFRDVTNTCLSKTATYVETLVSPLTGSGV